MGRVAELAELPLAAREATAGRRALVLLGGDSGVGKTRLVVELEPELSREPDQAIVLRGERVEQADGSFPTRRCRARCDRRSARTTLRWRPSAPAAGPSWRRSSPASTTADPKLATGTVWPPGMRSRRLTESLPTTSEGTMRRLSRPVQN